MKQHLRSLFMLLILVVWASGSFAQEKTYSYTFVKGGVFTQAKQTKIFNKISWDFATQGKQFQFDGNLKAFRVGSRSTPANEITFTTEGFAGTIKSVSIEGKNDNDKGNAKVYVTVGGTTYNSTKQAFTTNFDRYTLTGSSSGTLQIKITCTGKSAVIIKTITVVYEEASTSLPLNETTTAEDAKTLLGANLNKTVNVTINRTLVANKWNTLCLPFNVTAEQIKNILKAEGMVREYKDQNADCIYFQAAETMTAGVPYLIKPTEDVKGLTFEGVKITAVEGKTKGGIGSENLAISGILGARKLESFELFLNADGKFVAPAKGKETMKGFRAYFISLLGAGAKINIDGETTGINSIETEATVNGKVYNLNGQYVGNSLNGLKKGIYVVNGKKVIK